MARKALLICLYLLEYCIVMHSNQMQSRRATEAGKELKNQNGA